MNEKYLDYEGLEYLWSKLKRKAKEYAYINDKNVVIGDNSVTIPDVNLETKRAVEAEEEISNNFYNYYTKEEADKKFITETTDPGNCYTKTESDEKFLSKTDAENTYQPKGEYLTEHLDVSEFATKTELKNVQDKVDKKIEKVELIKGDSDLIYDLFVDGQKISTLNIPEDLFLKSVDYNEKELIFVFNTTEGETITRIDISDLVDVYTAGDGLDLTNNKFSVVIDKNSESYLQLTKEGLKIFGIDSALAKKANVGVSYTKSESDARYLQEHQDISNLATKTELSTEKSRAEKAESDLNTFISNEKERAESAETLLSEKWNALSTNKADKTDLTAEETRATKAEQDILTELSNYKESNDKALLDEITRATNAESQLTTDIEKEISDREAAVSSEKKRAEQAEKTLLDNIDSLDSSKADKSQLLQSDWKVTDTESLAFIKNKPTKLSDFTNDIGAVTDVSDKVDVSQLDNYYTKTEADSKFLTKHQNITGKANKDEMSVSTSNDKTTITLKQGLSTTVINKHLDISGKADKTELENYYTKTEADNKFLIEHLDLSELTTAINNEISARQSADTTLLNNIDLKANKTSVYTKTESDNKYLPKGNYLTEHLSLADYATYDDLLKVLGEEDLTSVADNPIIPRIEQLEENTSVISSKADKSNTVTNVAYTNKKIIKTINGVTTDVVTASKIIQDAGALTSHLSLAGLVSNAVYNSSTKRINFTDKDGTQVCYVDASDFIKDGMVSNVSITNGNLVVTFNTDAGKDPISIPITSIFNASNYYTKTDTDNKFLTKTDAAATYLTSHQDVSGKANKSEMNVSTNGDKTTITLKSGTSATVLNAHQDISGKANKATTLSGYGITDGVNAVTVTGTGNAVTTASVSGHTITLTKGSTFLTSHLDISGKADTSLAISNISRSGTTFTATRADGTTFTFTLLDNNTWKAANTSLEGYVPKLALASTATIASQANEYVLTYINGTETAPVWRKLPTLAFANTTYSAGTANILNTGTDTANRVWTAKILADKFSGKADKSATVSTIAYDTTNKKITKTIDGSTTDVVTAAKIVADGGGITSHLAVSNKGATLAWGAATTVATIGSTDIKVSLPANPNVDTKVTISSTNPTTGTWYYPIWVTGTGTNGVSMNNGLQYYALEGTADALGHSIISVGNAKASGTADNKRGRLRIYSENTGYADIYYANTTDNTYHTFPSTGGTILNSGTSAVSGDGGSTWGSSITVKINGTSKTLTIPANPNTNTWRNVYTGGVSRVGTGIGTKAINFVAGSNVSISYLAAGTGDNLSGSADYFSVKIAATNTWTAWKGATSSAAGTAGYMPAPTAAQYQQFLRGDGTWVSLNNYSLPAATTSALGGLKVSNKLTSALTLTSGNGTTANRFYGVLMDSNNVAFVNVPWTNTTYTNFVKSGADAKAGLVPSPGTTAGTAKYLREDATWQTPPNNAVTLTATTTSAAYELLFSNTADNTTRTEGARKTSTLTYNPSTKALSTGGTVNGYTLNAASAKGVDTSIDAASTSANLPTSAAVAAFVEGKKYLTAHLSLANYVTLNTAQTITAKKTFSAAPLIDISSTDIADKAQATLLSARYKSKLQFAEVPIIAALGSNQTNSYNFDIRVGSTSGALWLSAGESSLVFNTKLNIENTEDIWLTADGKVHFYTGAANDCSSYTNTANITTEGILPGTDNARNLGSSSLKWSNLYAVTGNYTGLIKSTLATGTAPITVTSTTVCTNLNANFVGGYSQDKLMRYLSSYNLENNLTGNWVIPINPHTGMENLYGAILLWSNTCSVAPDTTNANNNWYYLLLGTTTTDLRWRRRTNGREWNAWETLVDSNNYTSWCANKTLSNVTIANHTANDTEYQPVWFNGSARIYSSSNFTYNPKKNQITAALFNGFANHCQGYTTSRAPKAVTRWHKIATLTITLLYRYSGVLLSVTDCALVSSTAVSGIISAKIQQLAAMGTASNKVIELVAGNLTPDIVKGVYTTTSSATTLDIYIAGGLYVTYLVTCLARGDGVTLGTSSTYSDTALSWNVTPVIANHASKLGTATVGSTTKGIYLNAGTATAMTYSLSANVPAGAANRIVYFSGANQLASDSKIEILNTTNSLSKAVYGLYIHGSGFGKPEDLLSNENGVFSYGDGGPQIRFNCSELNLALIATHYDTAGANASLHLVSDLSRVCFTTQEIVAKTRLTIGANVPNTSYALHVTGDIYSTAKMYSASDIRYKKIINNIKNIDNNLVASLPLFTFAWKNKDDSPIQLGTSALAVNKIFPELVTRSDVWGVSYDVLGTAIGILNSRTLSKHEKEIEKLKKEIKKLKNIIKNYECNDYKD